MTLHAVLDDESNQNDLLTKMKAMLKSRFGIEHATIQIERGAFLCENTD